MIINTYKDFSYKEYSKILASFMFKINEGRTFHYCYHYNNSISIDVNGELNGDHYIINIYLLKGEIVESIFDAPYSIIINNNKITKMLWDNHRTIGYTFFELYFNTEIYFYYLNQIKYSKHTYMLIML